MINLNTLNTLNIINNTSNDKINIKNDNNVSESKPDFKEIINRVNSTLNKTDSEKEVSKEVEKISNQEIDSLTDKIKEVSKKIEDNEDVTEELTELVALLNYIIVDNSTLPIVINEEALTDIDVTELIEAIGIESGENEIITSNLNNNLLDGLNGDNEGDLNILLKEIVENLSSNKVDVKEFINTVDNDLEGILSLLNAVDTDMEKILPLITTDKGTEVTVKNILASIKNILSKEQVEDVNTANTANNIVAIDDGIKGNNDFNSETSYSDFLNESKENEVLNEEDVILSKLVSNENNDFSKALNNIQSRGRLTQSVVNEPVTVYKANMENDIIKNVKFMIRNSIQELKVKIYPKELGEMTVKILSEEGIMRAEIKATSKETYNLLNTNINEIKKLLSNENIKIQDIQLGLYSDDTTFFSGENSKEHSQGKEMFNSVGRVNSTDDEITNEDIHEKINEDINVNLLV